VDRAFRISHSSCNSVGKSRAENCRCRDRDWVSFPSCREYTGHHSHSCSIWLADLSARLPKSVRLDDLDISSNATPPTKWLPTNMTIHHWDVRLDVPEHLVGVYDIVHIRNFVFVLQDAEVERIIRNLYKLTSTFLFLNSHKSLDRY